MSKKLLAAGFVALALWVLFGCMTAKKVHSYLDDHPQMTAQECATRFPVVPHVDTTVILNVDTAGYNQTYNELYLFADSVLRARSKTDTVHAFDTIRVAVVKQLRASLKPCKDSIIYVNKTVPDSAKTKLLQVQLDAAHADQVELKALKQKQKQIGYISGLFFSWLIRQWWFWIVVAGVGGYLFRNMIPGLSFITNFLKR